MRATPAPLLSVLTMPGPDDPWVGGDGAFRIMIHPRLGWPMAPFALFGTNREPGFTEPGWRLSGPGAFGNEDVDGEAWLVLFAPTIQSDPGYVVLDLRFDDPPEVAVVRSVGDQGLGIVTRTSDPYRLAAPGIAVIRIRGRCHIDAVRTAGGDIDFGHDDARVLALPVPDSWPHYHSVVDPREMARERVRNGAPQRAGPHEDELDEDPADAEERRVSALVEPWVMPTLEGWLARPIDDRYTRSVIDDIGGRPMPTHADLDDHSGILVAATDPGVARWLGLSDQVTRSGGATALLTVAGVWALPASHELNRLAFLLNDPGAIRGHLFDVFNERVLLDLEELGQSFQLLWGWTQAWIDFDVLPDRPPPPQLSQTAPPTWIAGAEPADDVSIVAVEAHRVALLGSLGVAPVGSTPPVHAEIDGAPGRLRPLLAGEGTALTTRFAEPFEPHAFVVHQSDAFGRWSDTGADLDVPPPARPGLPSPQPIVGRTMDGPVGDQPWSPVLDVRVPVPRRAPGQPEIRHVVVRGEGDPFEPGIGAGSEVACQVAGPAIEPGESAQAHVTVTFFGWPASSSETDRTITINDPRPPASPPTPPVLHFASRADATGVSTAVVPLLPGARIAGYHVDVAHERDLVAVSAIQPPAGFGRDARARFWLQQPRAALAPAFYRAVPGTVPIADGAYHHALPGDLAELVAFRMVPVGTNGASADSVACPLVFFAVPLAIVPPPPLLTIDRSVAPPALVVTSRPGGAPLARHRVRLLDPSSDDPRAGRVVASGPMSGEEERAPVPSLRPFARAVLVAEVRGEDEIGQPPLPGRWSPPSNRLVHLAVPDGPPDFVTSARRDGTAVVLEIDPDGSPNLLSDYAAMIYRRDPASGAFVVSRGPIILGVRLDDGGPLPSEDLAVVVIDPIGRRSPTVLVEPDTP